MKTIVKLAIAATIILLPACSEITGDSDASNPHKSIVLTDKQREYVKAGHKFDFNYIYEVAKQANGDWFVSPLGAQMMLGMMLNGANGETSEQIYDVLGYGKNELSEVNEYVRTLLQQLPELDLWSDITIANAAILNSDRSNNPSFKDAMQDYFLANVEELDFSRKSSSSKINNWCNRVTSGNIKNIVADDLLEKRLAVLLNGSCFSGQWRERFPKSQTTKEIFYLENGREKMVPMMKLTGKPIVWGGGGSVYFILKIPFGNQSYEMTIYAIDRGFPLIKIIELLATNDIYRFYNGVDDPSPNAEEQKERTDFWNTSQKFMRPSEMELWLPRFETTSTVDLNKILANMGMSSVFQSDSDFSGISPGNGILGTVRQKNYIKIDESGKSGLEPNLPEQELGFPLDKATIHCNTPFLYVITETSTGLILFAGAYTGA